MIVYILYNYYFRIKEKSRPTVLLIRILIADAVFFTATRALFYGFSIYNRQASRVFARYFHVHCIYACCLEAAEIIIISFRRIYVPHGFVQGIRRIEKRTESSYNYEGIIYCTVYDVCVNCQWLGVIKDIKYKT